MSETTIDLAVFGGLFLLVVVVVFVRGFRKPDAQRGQSGNRSGILSRRYIDDQFKRPPDESELL